MTFSDSTNTAFVVLASVSSVLILLAPLFRITHLLGTAELGDHDGTPYAMMWISSGFWLLYALPADLLAVAIVNVLGVVAGFAYMTIWISYVPVAKYEARRMAYYILVPVFLTAQLTLLLVAWFNDWSFSTDRQVFGVLAAIFNVIFSYSPLVSGLITRHVHGIDPALVYTFLFNYLFWVLYAVGIDDLYLLIPNALGLLAATIALVLLIWKGCSAKSYTML